MKKIISASYPSKACHLWFGGFPGVLTALPEGEDIKYLFEMAHVYSVDDSDVDFYMLEFYYQPEEDFFEWAKGIDKEKIIIGGNATYWYPELFSTVAGKVIQGNCDEIWETISQPGQVVKGITKFKKLPRYDVFDLNAAYARSPKGDDWYGFATSFGCYNNCDFCICSIPEMSHVLSKPLEYVAAEAKLMKELYGTKDSSFMYDANFTQVKHWKENLSAIHAIGLANTHTFFASANFIKPEDAPFMKAHNVECVTLGLEDINQYYPKNKNLAEICEALYENKIAVKVTYIINPEDVLTPEGNNAYYLKMIDWVESIKPIRLEGHYLYIRPGTSLYNKSLKRKDLDLKKYEETVHDDISLLNFWTNDRQKTEQILRVKQEFETAYYTSDFYRHILGKHFYENNAFKFYK